MRTASLRILFLVTAWAALLVSPVAPEAQTKTGELSSWDSYVFEETAAWGTASVEIGRPSLRYKLVTLLGEPVLSLQLKYRVNGLVLKHKDGRQRRIVITSDPLERVDDAYTTYVQTDGAGVLRVGTEVAKSLYLTDVDIYAQMTRGNAAIYRQLPGVLSRSGVWSRDIPGSPDWSRLFVHPLTNLFTSRPDLDEDDYLDASTAREVWRANTEPGAFEPFSAFKLSNGRFTLASFIARINEVNPEALRDFFNPTELDDQVSALLGAYIGASEALRDDNGYPGSGDLLERRRKLTVLSLNALNEAGVVDKATYNVLALIYWDQAFAEIDRKLSQLADNSLAVFEAPVDPKAVKNLIAGLARLKDDALRIRSDLPRGLEARFTRLERLFARLCPAPETGQCKEPAPPPKTQTVAVKAKENSPGLFEDLPFKEPNAIEAFERGLIYFRKNLTPDENPNGNSHSCHIFAKHPQTGKTIPISISGGTWCSLFVSSDGKTVMIQAIYLPDKGQPRPERTMHQCSYATSFYPDSLNFRHSFNEYGRCKPQG